jgi:hypothetical protein
MNEMDKITKEQRKEERNDTTGNRWETNTEERKGDKNTKKDIEKEVIIIPYKISRVV